MAVVFEGKAGDVVAYAMHYRDKGTWHSFRNRAVTFWTSEVTYKMPDGSYTKLPVRQSPSIRHLRRTHMTPMPVDPHSTPLPLSP
mgnify:CR=1 FL=1